MSLRDKLNKIGRLLSNKHRVEILSVLVQCAYTNNMFGRKFKMLIYEQSIVDFYILIIILIKLLSSLDFVVC